MSACASRVLPSRVVLGVAVAGMFIVAMVQPALGGGPSDAEGGFVLLATEQPPQVRDSLNYLYFYDGNGDVGQMVEWRPDLTDPPGAWASERLVAHYEYDPYGNITAQFGYYAASNPIRFSTKYLDAETGLSYFGHRYYAPGLGRWISRDPIEETGHTLTTGTISDALRYDADPTRPDTHRRRPMPTQPGVQHSEPENMASAQPYSYVGGAVTMMVDPLGLERCYAGRCACDGGSVRVTVYRSSWVNYFALCITLPDWTIHCATSYSCTRWLSIRSTVAADAKVINPILNHECGHICDLKRSLLHYLVGALPWVDYALPAPTGGLGKARPFTKA